MEIGRRSIALGHVIGIGDAVGLLAEGGAGHVKGGGVDHVTGGGVALVTGGGAGHVTGGAGAGTGTEGEVEVEEGGTGKSNSWVISFGQLSCCQMCHEFDLL